MNLEEGLRQSLDVIRSNKARAFLTMLGINFGVGSLIAIAMVGLSFREYINTAFSEFGSQLVWVSVNNEAYVSNERRIYLDDQDIGFFKNYLPGLNYSSTIFNYTSQASYKGRGKTVTIMGVDPGHNEIMAVELEKGRFFLDQDVKLHRAVCVLKPDIAQYLFGDEDPIGKMVSVFDRPYIVVGVTKDKGRTFMSDGSDNNSIYVPSDFVGERIWGGSVNKYFIYLMKFASIEDVDRSIGRMDGYFENRYGLLRGEKRFTIQKSDSYIKITNDVLNIISTLILVIASVSLLVGGLGIMNIMLVTVTERTREIGLRMAVGAKQTDIMIQFIIEAVTMCLLGGGVGTVFGIGLATITCLILKWPIIFSLVAVVAALTISTVIGLLFGIYPAYKASRLTPIDALRVEQ
jgi:putative ABC transport system permease protein